MGDERTFQAPPGMEDALPERVGLWRRVEEAARQAAIRFGYEEVRTPLMEFTSLFHKSTGETSDIVEKEMFTFGTGEDSLSLRPELTPSVVRVLIEHNLHRKKGFWKFFYLGPVFRHERPQKGRYRQFHQFGVEAIGSRDPLLDAETILLYSEFLRALSIPDAELLLNSIGCPGCRGAYREVLREAIRPNLLRHCENCRKRFDRNVFRILDCKIETCLKMTSDLPPVIDHVCGDCRLHFQAVEKALKAEGVPYRVDPRIVRGLDYYTRTVYEFRSGRLGSQNAICGGGRYDTLVRDMGGPDLGAVGFASGLERILLLLEGAASEAAPRLDFYIVSIGEESRESSFRLAGELRRAGCSGDLDFEARSVKAQMRSADRSGARAALVLGKDEIDKGVVKLKNLSSGEESEVVRAGVGEALRRIRS